MLTMSPPAPATRRVEPGQRQMFPAERQRGNGQAPRQVMQQEVMLWPGRG